MNRSIGAWIFTLLIILSIPPLVWVIQIVNAILYENGTCTNDNLMRRHNQTVITNGTVDDFLKSLPSDNMILAEIVCQDNLNGTITK
jgi:hypothetical protein